MEISLDETIGKELTVINGQYLGAKIRKRKVSEEEMSYRFFISIYVHFPRETEEKSFIRRLLLWECLIHFPFTHKIINFYAFCIIVNRTPFIVLFLSTKIKN